MAGVKGDFGKLEDLIRNLSRAQKADYTKPMLQAIGDAAVQMIDKNIAAQKDPYDKAWPKSRDPNKGKVLLSLRGTFSASLRGKRRVIVSSKDANAIYHQSGGKKLPRRLLVPTRTRGLPGRWAQAFRQIAFASMLRYLFKRGS